MNGGQFMVVMIVAIVMIANIFKAKHKHRGAIGPEMIEHLRGEGSRDTQALRAEVQQLRDRIQVLERVITDQHKSIDLDREIERLRDR